MTTKLSIKSFSQVLKQRSAIIGFSLGIVGGAAGFAGAVNLMNTHDQNNSYDGASLIKASDLTPVKPMAMPGSFADLIERVSPAVVSITIEGKEKVGEAGVPSLPGFDFGEGNSTQPAERKVRGAGSGFFISGDGYIVTNYHVIENAQSIKIKRSNDQILTAKVIGTDQNTDLAVLKVEGKDFPFVTFENKIKPRVGDWVIAVGNPFEQSGTATAGIVSAFGRKDGGQGFVDYMQIDAAINPGNSGGPSFDIYGRVIGVNSAIISTSGANAGIGLAIPADIANNIVQKLIHGGKVERGYIGVALQPVTEEIAESLNIKDMDGAFIADVTKDGPADKAGIQVGDIVKSVNGQVIKESTDLTKKIATVSPGEKVKITVWRNGKLIELVLTSGLRPSEDVLRARLGGDDSASDSSPDAKADSKILGLSLKLLTPELRKHYGINNEVTGLVITAIDPQSDAADKGVAPGDVITLADNAPVKSREEFVKLVDKYKADKRPSILVFINRKGVKVAVPLSLK